MRPPVVLDGELCSAQVSFGFEHINHYHNEDQRGPQYFGRSRHSIVVMPNSPKPNLAVRTHELVSMHRPQREDASLNSHPQNFMLTHQTLSHFEMARLEKDRRDWRELATFLRTNEPPTTNYMSNTDDGAADGKPKKRNGSLRMFRRTAAKKSPSTFNKPLQLPDSAVAARTTKGHWHIAISIPLSAIGTFADDVHRATSAPLRVVEEEEPTKSPSPQPPAYRAASAQLTRSASISPTPSQSSIHPALRKEASSPTLSIDKDRSDGLGNEAANVMKNYYRQERLLNDEGAPRPGLQSLDEVLSSSNRSSQASPTSPVSAARLTKRGTFGTVYANSNDIERNNSHRTDPRHSGGSSYSEKTLQTQGHSRDTSGGSTIGQMPNSIELPPRSSSRQTRSSEDGGREAVTSVNSTRVVQRTGSASRSHKTSSSGDSASNIAMIEATEGLQHQLASSMRTAPRTPAPTCALPDLPEVSEDGCACPNYNRHGRSVSEGGKYASPPDSKVQLQDRQEKVKALRMRDIAAQKAKQRRRSTHPPATNVNMVCAPGCQHARSQEEIRTPAARNNSNRSARHVASASAIHLKAVAASASIAISPIRTIASTSPVGAQLQPQMYSCATPTSTSQSLPDDFLDSLLPSYEYQRISSAAQRHSNLSNSATNISSQPMTEDRRSSARSGRSDGDRTIRTLTPPRSLSPSFASSDEDGVHLPRTPHSIAHSRQHSTLPHTPSNTSKKRDSGFVHRKRDSGESVEDAKEIKERMKRLERDNERILKTLQAIMGMQQGVQELCELFAPTSRPTTSGKRWPMTEGEAAALRVSKTLEPAPLSLRGSPRKSEEEDDMGRRMRDLEAEMGARGYGGFGRGGKGGERGLDEWQELSAVEPLMREVRMTARVSRESRRGASDGEDEGEGWLMR